MDHPFTPDQIAFIHDIISKRLLQSKAKAKPNTQRNYHTVPEIRLLISSNIDGLKNDIGSEEFDISIFRFFLKKYTDLRPGDEEHVDGSCTRFDSQVSNAIRPELWPNGDCPITSTGTTRKYKFSNFIAQSTFNLQ